MLAKQTDPALGTWQLDAGKSRGQGVPQQQEMKVEEQGDDLLVTITGTYPNGSPVNVRYTVPRQGGRGRIMAGPFDAVESSSPEGNSRRLSYFKDGAEVTTVRAEFAEDGQSLTVSREGLSVLGEVAPATMVFRRT